MPVKKVKKLITIETQRIKKLILWTRVRGILLTILGIGSAFFGLEGFLLPNGFLDGGVTGVSLLLNSLTGIDLALLIFTINIPFFILGYYQIGFNFALKSFFAVLALVLMLKFVDISVVTDDKLLVAIFGGFFLGAGIGLAVRGGSVIDGTEVLAVFVSKNSFLSVGDFIGIFNVCLFLVAAFFIGIETALYSMLTYIAASKTVDFVIQGIEEYIGVTIISKKAGEIERMIVQVLKKGVTVIDSSEGFGVNGIDHDERKVLFSVVTRLEVQKMMIEIQKIDENAFVTHHSISHVKGGTVKRRPLH